MSACSANASRIDARTFRAVLGRFATGIVVVSAESDGAPHAMTANAFMSGSLEPPLIIVSIARRARMHALLERSPAFGVPMLTEAQEGHSRHFAGERVDECRPCFRQFGGVPILADGEAALAAHTVHRYACGDHTIFVGAVQTFEIGSDIGAPLLFYAGRYAMLGAAKGTGTLPFFY